MDYAGYLTPYCVECEHWASDSDWTDGCIRSMMCEHLQPEQMKLFDVKNPKMKTYAFKGLVIVNDNWTVNHESITQAVSKPKALNNLTYRWKVDHGYAPNANVILIGDIRVVDQKE